MEYRKIYDSGGTDQGFMKERREALLPGEYYRVAGVLTLAEGRLLVTQRAKGKTFPHEWEVTVGSLIEEESPREGALRELSEEVGIKAQREELTPIDCIREEDKFCYLYLLEREMIPPVTCQVEEVEAYEWVDYERLRAMMREGAFARPMERRLYRHLPLLKTHLEGRA